MSAENDCIELLDSSSDDDEANEPVAPPQRNNGHDANDAICIDSSDSSDDNDSSDDEAAKRASFSSRKRPPVPVLKQEAIEIDLSSDDDDDDESDDYDSSDDERNRLWHMNGCVKSSGAVKSESAVASKPAANVQVMGAKKPAAKEPLPAHTRQPEEERAAIVRQPKDPPRSEPLVSQNRTKGIVSLEQLRNNGKEPKQAQNVCASSHTLPVPPRKRALSSRPTIPSLERQQSRQVSSKQQLDHSPPSRQQQRKLSPNHEHATIASGIRPNRANNNSASTLDPVFSYRSLTNPATKGHNSESNSGKSSIPSGPSVFGKHPANEIRPTTGNNTAGKTKPGFSYKSLANRLPKKHKSDGNSGKAPVPTGPVSAKRSVNGLPRNPLTAPIPRKSPPKQSSAPAPREQPLVEESNSTKRPWKRSSVRGTSKMPPLGGMKSDSSRTQPQQQSNVPVPRKQTHLKDTKSPSKRLSVHGTSKKSALGTMKSDASRQQQRRSSLPTKRHAIFASRESMQSQLTPSKSASSSGGSQFSKLKQAGKKTQTSFGAPARKRKSGAPHPPDEDSLVALGRKAGKRSSLTNTTRSSLTSTKESSLINARIRQAAKAKSSPNPSPAKLGNSHRTKTESILKDRNDTRMIDPTNKKVESQVSNPPPVSLSMLDEKASGHSRSSGGEPRRLDSAGVAAASLLKKNVSREQRVKQLETAEVAVSSLSKNDEPRKQEKLPSNVGSNSRLLEKEAAAHESRTVGGEPHPPHVQKPESEVVLATPHQKQDSVRESSSTISPKMLGDELADNSHSGSEEPSDEMSEETPFPNKDIPVEERTRASSGSVVSPTEESLDRLSVTTVNQRELSDSREGDDDDAATHGEPSTENTEVLLSKSSSTLDTTESPMVESQASYFAASSDSESEAADEEFVEEKADMLRDSLTMDEGLIPWTRRTRKKINYKESRGALQLSDSQLFLDDSAPNKRQKVDTYVVDKAEESDTKDTVVSSSRPKRNRQPTNMFSPEASRDQASTPELDEDEEADDPDLKASLPNIEHSSVYTYDKDGFPTHDFSVYSSDDMIFDLRIQVRPSGIPGSGMGAFLTFRGARVLKDGPRKLATKKREECVYYEPETRQPLGAILPDRYVVSVKLTGKNLHGNNNSPFWPPTSLPTSSTSEEGDEFGVKLSGDHLNSDDSDEEDETLKRVGPLGIHTEDDFAPDSTIELRTVDFSVELGRYGPVLKSDRKREPDFDVKNYLFSDAPAEYGFGVDARLGGCNQVIDLTDDSTGTRHQQALRLPMSYINEVGHSPNLKANVHIRDKDGHSVFYFLKLVKPLKKGESVELLADYDEMYEPVRERKGYGRANLENGVKSNDHEPTALARNFEERHFIEKLIGDLGVVGLFHLTEFIFESVFIPLNRLIVNFLRGGLPEVKPTCLQWVARQRLGWVGGLIIEQSSRLLRELPERLLPGFPHKGLLEQVSKWGKQMQWNLFLQSVNALEKRDVAAWEALKSSSKEDTLYVLANKIVKPLDEAMWCPVAAELIRSLCDDTTSSLSLGDGARETYLLQSYLRRAREAADMIRGACRNKDASTLSMLKFVSSVAKDEIVTESTVRDFDGFKESGLFSKHTTLRKGVLATMIDVQCYRDALEVGSLSSESMDLKIIPQATSHDVVIVDGGSPATSTSNETGVFGYPRHVDSAATKDLGISEEWYLLWQVVFVVHCFAEEFIAKPSSGGTKYSLARLCTHIGVDIAKAQAVVDQGIDTTEYSVAFTDKTPRKKRAARKKAPRQRAPSQAVQSASKAPSINRELFDAVIWKSLLGIGWKLDVGNRPRDFYYLPPGVERRRGWVNRTDYFDSTKLVMAFIKADSRWKDRPEVVEALDLFDKLDKLRVAKKLPKNWRKFDVERLKEELEQS